MPRRKWTTPGGRQTYYLVEAGQRVIGKLHGTTSADAEPVPHVMKPRTSEPQRLRRQ